jgi:hypothetical protein|tara:strand:- start:16 stop:1041 length:1026 start_codon:yes stop_codon:yes gene_type:complete
MAYKLKSSVDSLCGSPAKAIDPMYNGKKGVQQADFEQFSSAAKMNAEKGTNPIYNLSGKKGLQPSNNPAAAYMTGSPLNNYSLFHTHNSSKSTETKTSKKGTSAYDPMIELQTNTDKITTQVKDIDGNMINQRTGEIDVDATNRAKAGIVDGMGITQSSTDQPTALDRQNQNRKAKATISTPPPKPKQKPKPKQVVRSSNSNNPPPLTQGDAAKLKSIKANENKNSPPPEALTGSDAVRLAKIKEKKKGKEMSRGEIREAKKKDKDSGMSRKQVRANKLKRKADSAKAKTNKTIKSIDPTKAKSADTGAKQTKAKSQRAKTIRLQKKAAKIEGRVKASKIK